MPQLISDVITSSVQKRNRASGGARKANYRVEGSLKTQLKRDAAVDLLLESGLSGTFATNVLKAGNTDTSVTFEKKMLEGATPYYHRFTGVQVSSVSLSCEASGAAEISFGLIGMDRSTSTTAIASSTYAATASTTNLTGLDVSAVTVAGVSADFRSLELTVEHDREAQDKFGTPSARGIGTSGFRTVKLTVTLYRADLSVDTLFAKSDTPVAVSFTIGSALNGYTFALPAATANIPQDSEDASKALVTIEFTAQYDNTALTDLQITKLT